MARADQTEQGTNTAFEKVNRSLQQSEIARAELLLKVLIVAIGLAVVRNAAGGTVLTGTTYRLTLVVLMIGVGYATVVRMVVRRAEQRGVMLPSQLWTATTVLETFIPTTLLGIRMLYSSLDDVTATHSPSMLYYTILAVVSVLRLRPLLCIMGGVLCAIQHATLIGIAVHTSDPPVERGLLPLLFSYPVLVLLAWVCAAIVVQHLRRSIESYAAGGDGSAVAAK
jgi:hypothetical protein